ncbi:MAG: DUF2244 domain-containing protein [Gammaproteobacteria bacterium]|tara:strand:- start:1652 stop:2140 length:489 start_codon:yes stop_codon:yes gene_type:complete
MVTSDRLDSGNAFRISLFPNRSISWKGNLWFLALVSTPITIIAFGFLYVGAPIILPFAGLEILIVLSASYYVFRNVNKQEILTFTPERLIIEKGRLRPETTTEFIREWSYVFIEKPTHPWYPLHVVISSKGERVPIGDFLTEEDKKILIEKMDEIIQELRSI